ncbi:DUF1996 domain-containing protein [Streptomyces tropicalis]|uniref:DUF1996 domain-containing protein n=1 Tax=Streptomyces tropicalis TaxID=3034234 RepID=A0ABT6A3E5_9ACTN|nr:DUF1996 domain-containing protein [Streptomyces tropicalis]MDF3299175.1 DUF1996 domain-containing protein [Streptomyces tropicalis]
MLGGGGLLAANVYASATEGPWSGRTDRAAAGQGWSATGTTIDCPDVGTRLTDVPEGARAEVDGQLAVLDQQIARAYQQMQGAAAAGQQDAGAVQSGVMDPLKERRTATLGRIADAMDHAGHRPDGLDGLAACTLRTPTDQGGGSGQPGQEQGQDGSSGQGTGAGGGRQGQTGPQGGAGGNGGQAGNGPVAADYADITTVQPDAQRPPQQDGASTGTFSSSCGVNANGLFNSDNVIVAPGVANGAHHFHDYVGNQSNTAFAGDDDLAKADTSCADKGDRSTYYWPVLRLQNGTRERDADAPGGGTEGNAGRIVTPKQVTLTFEGSPHGRVTAMPRLLRIITGDAKAFVNGPANANASWSCTGFEDRQLKDKYPLCPQGSDVVRTFRFQSCWDGRNIDSANHRTHVAFAAADGTCPAGFEAIPQLVQRIVYAVAAPSLQDGGRTTPLFAVDSFPEQLHKPVTDHGDFINVFDASLMREMVDCINGGRHCGAGAGQDPGGQPEPSQSAQDPRPSPSQSAATPQDPPAATGRPQQPGPSRQPTTVPGDGNGGTAGGTHDGGNGGAQGGGSTGRGAGTGDGGGGAGSGGAPARGTAGPTAGPGDRGAPSLLATVRPESGTGAGAGSRSGRGGGASPSAAAGSGGSSVGTPTQTPPPAEGSGVPGNGTAPQTAGSGSLAETGAQLWPAAAGAVLLIAGFLLLRRVRRDGV